MLELLIICGGFPPQNDEGGLRAVMMVKYLPKYGRAVGGDFNEFFNG
jgi:hypothetical protein